MSKTYVTLGNKKKKTNILSTLILILLFIIVAIVIVFTKNDVGNSIREKLNIDFYIGQTKEQDTYKNDNTQNNKNDQYISNDSTIKDKQDELIDSGYIPPINANDNDEYNGSYVVDENGNLIKVENSTNSNITNNNETYEKMHQKYKYVYDNAHKTYVKNSNHANSILKAINELRKEKGLKPLELDSTLCDMAGYRAYDMAYHQYYANEKDGVPVLFYLMYIYNRDCNCHKLDALRISSDNIENATNKAIEVWKDYEKSYELMTDQNIKHIGIAIDQDTNGYFYFSIVYSEQ